MLFTFVALLILNIIIMKLKPEVTMKNLKPQTVLGMILAESVHNRLFTNKEEMFITSISDGKHMQGSKHYTGEAFDIRTNYMTDKQKQRFFDFLKMQLDFNYDVVLEKTHIHIEYDDKRY